MSVPTNRDLQKEAITIQTIKTSYSPGDLVSGKIYLNIPSPQPSTQLDLKFSGFEYSHRVFITKRHDIVNTKWSLYKWDNELPAGHIEVPFSFMLPSNIPASFHQESDEKFFAHITYRLKARLDLKGNSTIKQHKKLVIRRPVTRIPKDFSEEQTVPLTACCIDYGFLTLRAHFEKDIYSEGDRAIATIEVDTSRSQLSVNQIQFNLIQKTNLGYCSNFTQRTYGANSPGVPARRRPKIYVLGFSIPPFIGDDHDMDSKSFIWRYTDTEGLGLATQGKIIRSEFFLEILIETGGTEGEDCLSYWRGPTATILHRIDISYPEPQEPQVILPDDWNPQVLPEYRLGPTGFSEKVMQNAENDDKQRMIETEMIPNKPLGLGNETKMLGLAGRQV